MGLQDVLTMSWEEEEEEDDDDDDDKCLLSICGKIGYGLWWNNMGSAEFIEGFLQMLRVYGA